MTHQYKATIEKVAEILFISILLVFMAVPAYALKSPDAYGMGECELIMKDYQDVYGGSFILIQPIDKNNQPILGEYSGHWINKAYSKERGIYYIDYETQTYFKDITEIKEWYWDWYSKKSIVYDFAITRPEFGIIWHY